MGQKSVLGRGTYGLSKPLGAIEQQDRGDHVGRADEGHAEHRQRVAGNGPGPVVPAPLDEVPGRHPQAIADELPCASNDSDNRCRGPEGREVGPDDAARALVDHVGEQADQAEAEDERPRPQPRPTRAICDRAQVAGQQLGQGSGAGCGDRRGFRRAPADAERSARRHRPRVRATGGSGCLRPRSGCQGARDARLPSRLARW